MTLDQRIRQRARFLIERAAKSITIRRVTRSSGAEPLENPPSVTTPTVQATVTAGNGTISITCASARGRLVAGDKFTIQGDPTIYTISGDVAAAANAFAGVAFTPNLTADANAGAAISLVYQADVAVKARISSFPEQIENGTLIRSSDLLVIVPALSISFEPTTSDVLIIDGKKNSIAAVTPDYAAEQVSAWRITAR